MDDQQPTPISSSDSPSVSILPESSTDAHIIDNLEQRSALDGPNHLSAPSDLPESQIVRIAHTCSRLFQWAICMAGMGLENIAFAHPALAVLTYIVHSLPLEGRHVTSENRGRAIVPPDYPMAVGERSDRVPSAQTQHQEMQIPTDHLTHSLSIMATPDERRQASQQGMQMPVEEQGGANDLHTQAASDEPAERALPIQTFNTAETSRGGYVANAGRDIIDNRITYSGIGDEALASMAFTTERLKNEFDDKVHDWLSVLDVSVNFNAARRKHQPDTGSWFINGAYFAQWKNKSENVLCLYGAPGCGKTILCSTIIKEIIELCESRSLSGYAYFFFDNRNADQGLLTFESFLRSLLSQLSYRCGGIPAALEKIYHAHESGRTQPSLESLNVTLRLMIEGFDHIYIMVDSLDECGDRAELLQWIQTTANWNSDKLHLLFTSRLEQGIRSQLDTIARVCRIMVDGKFQKDILLYLDEQLRPIQWNEETRNLVKSTVGERADGMFRWVALQIADLKKCLTLRDVKKQLKALPKDLEETYERILAKSDHRVELLQILHWLAFSTRALSLEELAEVVSVDLDADDGPSYDPDLKFSDPRSALTVCSGLVTETEEGRGYLARSIVKLAHFSVKEYLISDRARTRAEAGFFISEKIAHSVIAQTCLVLLMHFDVLESLKKSQLNSFPLASYADQYWLLHFRASEPANSALENLVSRFFSPMPCYAMVNWVRRNNPDRMKWYSMPPDMPFEDIASPLYYASYLGLRIVVDHLLTASADPQALGGYYVTALHAAIHQGGIEIATLLLDRGADVTIQAGDYGTALHAAIYKNQIEIIKLLLDRGADANIQGGRHGTALHAAIYEGRIEIAKLLLDRGADVNIQTGHYGTALQAALLQSRIEIATLLLDRGADVNIQAGHYGTALHAAIYKAQIEIIKLLLDRGADVNFRGGFYGTALHEAIYKDQIEIIKLLLDRGADVNIQTGFYGPALHAAICKGKLEIATLLLDRGADVNIQGGECGTALQVALSMNRTDVAELLRERGALDCEVLIDCGEHSEAESEAYSEEVLIPG